MPRLTIQYTVDSEDIESEVARFLSKANTILKNMSQDFARLSGGSVMSHGRIEQINQMRKSLSDIDYYLNDSSNIIQGYLEYKSSLYKKPNGKEDEVTTSIE